MKGNYPPIIAIIGSDGSGKSTVCKHLIHHVKKYGPAVRVHLGKQAGNVERVVIKLPLLGRFFAKAIKKNKVSTGKKNPGPIPAIVITFFVLRRLWRFKKMTNYRRRGFIVLTDRYPQLQIPGAYDGTVFPAQTSGCAFVNWLARIEHDAFIWMTEQKPGLVLKLNVDLEVACARKPDHQPESLAKKIAITPLLTFEGSSVVEIDANQPLDRVLAVAETAVSRFMETHGYRCLKESKAGINRQI